jgi:hypothetical protein
VHYLLTWQDKFSSQQIAEPAGLEAIGQDTGNSRGIADEGKPWQLRMQDMPV